MEYIFCAIIGYIIGMINPTFLIGKFERIDVRKKGLRNASCCNAFILFGKVGGCICALFDFAKGYLSVMLIEAVFPLAQYALPVTAVFCILGHIFPFYTDFIGGKGLSCLNGIILYFDWRVFLIAFAIELIVALTAKYACLVTLTASFAFPFVYGIINKDLIGALIFAFASIIIFLIHLENLRNMRRGIGITFSSLWNPQNEAANAKINPSERETEIKSAEDK